MEGWERAVLGRLFPDVSVKGETSYPVLMEQFEKQAQLAIENTKKQVYTIYNLIHMHVQYTVHVHVYCM